MSSLLMLHCYMLLHVVTWSCYMLHVHVLTRMLVLDVLSADGITDGWSRAREIYVSFTIINQCEKHYQVFLTG